MRCYCGYENTADAKYCLSCGATLPRSAPKPSEVPQPVTPSRPSQRAGDLPQQPPRDRKPVNQRAIIAIMAVIILGLGAFAAYPYARGYLHKRNAISDVDTMTVPHTLAFHAQGDSTMPLETAPQPDAPVIEEPAPAPAPQPVVTKPKRSQTAVQPPPEPVAAPQPKVGIIAAGSEFSAAAEGEFCSKNAKPGMELNVPIAAGIAGSNGFTIPAGSYAVLVVPDAGDPKRTEANPIGFSASRIITPDGNSFDVSADVLATQVVNKGKSGTGKKAILGALAGAAAAKILGKSNKTAVAAAAGGAAAGAAASQLSATNFCIPPGGRIDLKLTSTLTRTMQ